LSSIIVDVSRLRKAHKKDVEELEKFLKDKVKATITAADTEITLKLGEKGEIPKKDYLRVLLKKYLHKADLKEEFRVIAGKDKNILVIKERKIAGEAE
jgi:hypothetical protein